MADKQTEYHERAYFAGGCFWCVEAEFEQQDGVGQVISGYMGGDVENPTYEQVARKKTGHFEAVEVHYDASQISYERLLEIYWGNVDPLDPDGQFNDRGSPYYTAIFYQNEEEKAAALKSRADLAKTLDVTEDKIKVRLLPTAPFYAAEEYHQDYYKKNKIHYNLYKYGSGRVDRLKELYGDKK